MSDQSRPPQSHALTDAELGAMLQWWMRMSSESASGADRADRAVLRRCNTIQAVTHTAAYHRVYRAIRAQHEGEEWRAWQQDRLAMLVGLAAHVKRGGRKLALEMNRRAAGSDRPAVSEMRFRRLLDSPDVDSLFVSLRRVLPLVNHQLELRSLARDLFLWSDPIKQRWAYDYYDTTSVQPDETA